MAQEDVFSFKAVVVTAAVSFFISGVGGFYISEWQNRAKPELVVNSIGFTGSDELVEINSELIDLTNTSPWIRGYKKYEKYKSIDDDYQDLTDTEERLKNAVKSVEDWLNKKITWKTQSAISLDVSELLRVPYCIDSIVGSVRTYARA